MTTRKTIFLLGFLVIPVVFYVVLIGPALARRSASILRQSNAGKVVEEANKAIQNRDELVKQWEAFKPLADTALSSMEHDLNPLLIPRRVHNLARDEYDLKDIRIQPLAYKEENLVREFSFTLNGTYENIAGFVDALERGRQRVRFQTMKLMIQPGQTSKTKPNLSLSASFLIPVVPTFDDASTGSAAGEDHS